MDIDKITDDILNEIKAEEKQYEIKRKEIIKNGCPHSEKVEVTGTISKIKFLECKICLKQFYLDGQEITG